MCAQTLLFGILCTADFLVWLILSELLKDFSQLAKQEFNIELAEGIVPDFSFLFGGWVVVGGQLGRCSQVLDRVFSSGQHCNPSNIEACTAY